MTAEQEKALRDYLQESIVPLIEQVLVKKLGQAMSFAAEQLVQPKRTWVGLTDKEIDDVLGSDIQDEPSGLLEFVRAIEAKLKEKNT
jgi:hypothetical protein